MSQGEPLPGADGVVVVRRAAVGDVPALVRLLHEDAVGATREVSDPTPYHRAFQQVDADPSQLLVVAVDGEAVVGTLQLSVIPGLSRAGALRGQIEAVRVRADHRGRGTGSALVGWVLDEARRRGCSLVQLTTDKSRGRRAALLRAAGVRRLPRGAEAGPGRVTPRGCAGLPTLTR